MYKENINFQNYIATFNDIYILIVIDEYKLIEPKNAIR